MSGFAFTQPDRIEPLGDFGADGNQDLVGGKILGYWDQPLNRLESVAAQRSDRDVGCSTSQNCRTVGREGEVP